MSLAAKMVEKFGLDQRVLLVPFVVATTAPTFTVKIAGDDDAVPARRIAGQTLSVDDRGMALWLPPSQPICFETF